MPPAPETPGNAKKTVSNADLAGKLDDLIIAAHLNSQALAETELRLREIDEHVAALCDEVAQVTRFIAANADMLARARALADPGNGVRNWLTRKPAGSRG